MPPFYFIYSVPQYKQVNVSLLIAPPQQEQRRGVNPFTSILTGSSLTSSKTSETIVVLYSSSPSQNIIARIAATPTNIINIILKTPFLYLL